MSYAVVRTDRMYGTDNRDGLISVRYQPSDTMTAIENGCVVKAVELEKNEREVFKGVDPVQGDSLNDVVLIASPEVIYEKDRYNLNEYINEKGKICRGYRFHHGSIFSLTKEGLVGQEEPAVGNNVELTNGNKMNVAVSPTGEHTQVGKIIAVEKAGRDTYYVIKVD